MLVEVERPSGEKLWVNTSQIKFIDPSGHIVSEVVFDKDHTLYIKTSGVEKLRGKMSDETKEIIKTVVAAMLEGL